MTTALAGRVAGRELDGLIGERVMGLTIYRYRKGPPGSGYFILMDRDGNPAVVLAGPHAAERATEAEAWQDCPRYSTDETAAMQVIEHLASGQHDRGVVIQYMPRLSEPWSCGLTWRADDRYRVIVCRGADLPEAVCRAALAMVDQIERDIDAGRGGASCRS